MDAAFESGLFPKFLKENIFPFAGKNEKE